MQSTLRLLEEKEVKPADSAAQSKSMFTKDVYLGWEQIKKCIF